MSALTVVKAEAKEKDGEKTSRVEVTSWMEGLLPAEWCSCIRAKVRVETLRDFFLGLIVLALFVVLLENRAGRGLFFRTR